METIKDLVFHIFDSVADNAMERGYSVSISYENGRSASKTIISESNREGDALTLSAYPIDEKESCLVSGRGGNI